MKKADIIIFGGQSNMQGQTECLSETEIVENASEYRWLTDSLIPLKNPVGENITFNRTEGVDIDKCETQDEWLAMHAIGRSCKGRTNMVPEFCRAYTSRTKESVVAIHIAKGATEIAYWLPGTKAYEIFVEKANAGIKKAKEKFQISNIFFVWLQGESDAILKTGREKYEERMHKLNNAIKKDVGIDKFCVIRVGRYTEDEYDISIIEAQDKVCLENDDFLMLTQAATELNKIPEYMSPEIGGHYSAKGQEKLGRLAGDRLGLFATGKI